MFAQALQAPPDDPAGDNITATPLATLAARLLKGFGAWQE